MKISSRGAVPPFLILECFRDAEAMKRAGADIIHLSLGQPGVEAPPKVLQRVAARMQSAPLGYTEAAGLPELRHRIARHYRETYGVNVGAERIFITIGSSSAFVMGILSAFDAGDQVAITRPCYPAYPNMLRALNLEPVFLTGTEASRFQPTTAMLDALPETPDGLIIASPSNPTGTVLHGDELAVLAQYCDTHGIRLVSDEIYHGISYGAACETILQHTQNALVVNSFSKYYLMPGWRLGWAVVPPDLVRSFESLAQSFFIAPPTIAQYAALEVMECGTELGEVVAGYAVNRDLLLTELPRLGFTRLAPAEGGFFIYAEVSALTTDSVAFCRDMLHETGVVAVPGVDFDAARGHCYVRFSFSNSETAVREALRRLAGWKGLKRAA